MHYYSRRGKRRLSGWLRTAGVATVCCVLVVRCLAPAFVQARTSLGGPRRSSATAGLSGPGLLALKRISDVGPVRAGGRMRHDFPVRNKGSQRLIIRQYQPECECVSYASPPVMIGPGETGHVSVDAPVSAAIDVVGFDSQRGRKRLTRQFTTNDPQCPIVTFVLMGEAASTDRASARGNLDFFDRAARQDVKDDGLVIY